MNNITPEQIIIETLQEVNRIYADVVKDLQRRTEALERRERNRKKDWNDYGGWVALGLMIGLVALIISIIK